MVKQKMNDIPDQVSRTRDPSKNSLPLLQMNRNFSSFLLFSSLQVRLNRIRLPFIVKSMILLNEQRSNNVAGKLFEMSTTSQWREVLLPRWRVDSDFRYYLPCTSPENLANKHRECLSLRTDLRITNYQRLPSEITFRTRKDSRFCSSFNVAKFCGVIARIYRVSTENCFYSIESHILFPYIQHGW